MLDKLFRKQKEVQYIVKDTMLEKQNKIINRLIRISLDNSDIRKAAQKMIVEVKRPYTIKNCSLFIIDNTNELSYLATDIEEKYREHIKKYVNTINTDKDIVICEPESNECLSYVSAEKRNIVYSVFIKLKNIGAVFMEFDVKKDIRIFEEEVFKTIMESMTIALENLILRQKIIDLSRKDQLTNLYNRTYLNEYIKTLNDKKYSLAMIDIDFFKKINDTYGHAAGDDVLKYVSSVLKKISNSEVFRIGGEEFLITSFENKVNLFKLVEKIRLEIQNKSIESHGNVIKITISSGIADNDNAEDFEETQNKADQELYKAKENGRNKIYVYGVNE